MTAGVDQPHLGLVVEGRGDQNAVPVLLRSHFVAQGIHQDVLGKPIPVHGREKATRPRGIEGFVSVAASRPGCRAILVVLDGEGDCVGTMGPALLQRIQSVVGHKPSTVALADLQYEDWLHASIETLGLGDHVYDKDRSGISTIKAALAPAKYAKPVWQPRLTARLDLELAASRSESLARLLQRADDLLQAVI